MSALKPGDKVRVISKPPKKNEPPSWGSSMDEFCGEEFIVDRVIGKARVHIRDARSDTVNAWMWNEDWLKKVEEKPKFKFKKGDKVRVISEPPEDKREWPVWLSSMDRHCGKEFAVGVTDGYRGTIKLEGCEITWLEKWLEKVEEPEEKKWTQEEIKEKFPKGCEVKLPDNLVDRRQKVGITYLPNAVRALSGKVSTISGYSAGQYNSQYVGWPMVQGFVMHPEWLELVPKKWTQEEIKEKFPIGCRVRVPEDIKDKIKKIGWHHYSSLSVYEGKIAIVQGYNKREGVFYNGFPRIGKSHSNCWTVHPDWLEKVESKEVIKGWTVEKIKEKFPIGCKVRVADDMGKRRKELGIEDVKLPGTVGEIKTITGYWNSTDSFWSKFNGLPKIPSYIMHPDGLELVEADKSEKWTEKEIKKWTEKEIKEKFPIGSRVKITDDLVSLRKKAGLGGVTTGVKLMSGQIRTINDYCSEAYNQKHVNCPLIGGYIMYPEWLEVIEPIKVGDRVRIISKPPKPSTNDFGWNGSMDKLCGQTFKVKKQIDNNWELIGNDFCWMEQWLEKVGPEKVDSKKVDSKKVDSKKVDSKKWTQEEIKEKFPLGCMVKIADNLEPEIKNLGLGLPEKYCGEVATIKRYYRNGITGYDGFPIAFDFILHPNWLERVPKFKAGDRVRVIPKPSASQLEKLSSQISWRDNMEAFCGQEFVVDVLSVSKKGNWHLKGILSGKRNEWAWHEDWLEKVEPEEKANESWTEEEIKEKFPVGCKVQVADLQYVKDRLWLAVAHSSYGAERISGKVIEVNGHCKTNYAQARVGYPTVGGYYVHPNWLERIEWTKESIKEKFPIGCKVKVTEHLEVARKKLGLPELGSNKYSGKVVTIVKYHTNGVWPKCLGFPMIEGYIMHPDWLEVEPEKVEPEKVEPEKVEKIVETKFKVGDYVRIISEPPAELERWEIRPLWVTQMDEHCGKEFVVESFCTASTKAIRQFGWSWSDKHLEKVVPNKVSKFKKGDKVRVISKPPKDRVRRPSWVKKMDRFCGKEFTVEDVKPMNHKPQKFVVMLDYYWHDDWLEKVEEKVVSKFKKGDKVRVISEPPEDKRESPGWTDTMDKLCGQEFVIHQDCVRPFNLDFMWNPKWLEKVEENPTPKFKDGDRVRVISKPPEDKRNGSHVSWASVMDQYCGKEFFVVHSGRHPSFWGNLNLYYARKRNGTHANTYTWVEDWLEKVEEKTRFQWLKTIFTG